MAVIHVGPKAAIGEHDTFGISGSTRSIVNDGKFFRFILPITDVFGTEVFRIALSVECIAVLESSINRLSRQTTGVNSVI